LAPLKKAKGARKVAKSPRRQGKIRQWLIFVIRDGDLMNKIKSNPENLYDFTFWREIALFFSGESTFCQYSSNWPLPQTLFQGLP
jgi:hypothetical protein